MLFSPAALALIIDRYASSRGLDPAPPPIPGKSLPGLGGRRPAPIMGKEEVIE
jgi:hypothetical protein